MPSQLPPDVAGVLVPPLGTFAEGSAPCGEIMRLQSDHSRITVGSQSGHSRVIDFFMVLRRDEEKITEFL